MGRKITAPEGIQNIVDDYARKYGHKRAQLLEIIGNAYFFSGIYSDDEPPIPTGLPFNFMVKDEIIKDLPPFADFNAYV